ncbi:hypothetical protein [Streptomyces sp. NPDC004520]|uniref:hypothetical protein n=1 Tax=unclassified Streptomyces TaxID=2593676 RepID=UPI0036812BC6
MRTRGRRWAAVLVVTGALLTLPACTSSVDPADPIDPIERLGRKAAERVGPRPSPAETVRTVRAAVDAKRCEEPPVLRTATRPATRTGTRTVTPRSEELALRLTEC